MYLLCALCQELFQTPLVVLKRISSARKLLTPQVVLRRVIKKAIGVGGGAELHTVQYQRLSRRSL